MILENPRSWNLVKPMDWMKAKREGVWKVESKD
jgi:hypothetical protein